MRSSELGDRAGRPVLVAVLRTRTQNQRPEILCLPGVALPQFPSGMCHETGMISGDGAVIGFRTAAGPPVIPPHGEIGEAPSRATTP